MRTKRTRMHNPDGTIIYNTFNSTGLTPQYESTNPRFNTKFGKQVNENVVLTGKNRSESVPNF